jgi:hypothetical protein
MPRAKAKARDSATITGLTQDRELRLRAFFSLLLYTAFYAKMLFPFIIGKFFKK